MKTKQQFTNRLLIVLGSLTCLCAVAAEPARRPNVLFIISDDLSSRITPAGYAGLQTPVLDRLASEAVTFRNAYCQYPVCGPSRASFLSGLYPEAAGVLDNTTDIGKVAPGNALPAGRFPRRRLL